MDDQLHKEKLSEDCSEPAMCKEQHQKKEDLNQSQKLNESKTKHLIYPALNKAEVIFYAALWIFSYGIAVMQVYDLSQGYILKGIKDGNLERRESFMTRKKFYDSSDYEWELWNRWFLESVVLALTGHFVVMRISEIINPNHRFSVSALYTTMFCMYFFGWKALLILVAQSFLVFSAAFISHSITVVWLTTLPLVYVMNSEDIITKMRDVVASNDDFLVVLYICANSMNNLRYLAFCCEYCWDRQEQRLILNEKDGRLTEKKQEQDASSKPTFYRSFADMLIYQFYFPLFIGGPIINYNQFNEQTKKKGTASWSLRFIGKFLFGLLRYTFWHFFLNLSLYYVHFSSLHLDRRLVKEVPLLTLCGLALCYVQFFSMKYMVMYGLPSHYAISDNLEVPGAAHCVSSKHRFTDMWKYFDIGLHKWLVRYIYVPLGGSASNMSFIRTTFNSVLPFAYVYFWHGALRNHLFWAGLNWIGVYLEKIADDVYKTKKVQEFEARYLTPGWSRRVKAVLSSVPFSLLIISNLYFLCGVTCGNIYMKRAYTENLLGNVLVHVVLYSGVHTSMELTRLGF